MKIAIDYDFFNAIRNVNEPLTPMKVVRNYKKNFMVYGTIEIAIGAALKYEPSHIVQNIAIVYGGFFAIEYIAEIIVKLILKRQGHEINDINSALGEIRLLELVTMLNDINVKTNYEMLLKSELYKKEYKFEHSDNKLLSLNEKKYIYVPTYGYNGKEKITSILQEHDVGTKNYMLSVGEPEKQYKRVLVNNNA